jgi:hypothetical protein
LRRDIDECFAHAAEFSNSTMNRRTLLTSLTTLPVVFESAQIFAAVKKWCVGVIGHTGRGDYGHGLDTMWLRIPETEIVAACEKAGTKLAIAHRNRQHPILPVIAKLIEEGLIGRVLKMRGRGKEDARGGSLDLWVLGSHVINLACYFGGDPVTCSAEVKQDGRLITKADVREGDEAIGLLAGNEVHARYELNKGITLYFDSLLQ